VLGLSALAKLVVGFAVGAAGSRFLIAGTPARALVLLIAAASEALLVQWLATVFAVEAWPMSPLTLASRATLTAVTGAILYSLVDRRVQASEL
jgi:hypothetical protein